MSRVFVPRVLTATAALAAGFALGWFLRPVSIETPTSPGHAASPPVVAEPEAPETSVAPASAGGSVASAVRAVQRAPDRAARLYEFALRLRNLTPADYPVLWQALRATRSPESPEIFAMLCRVWAEHDGPAAFAAGRTLAIGDGFYGAFHAAIRAWAQHDPPAAQTALQAAGLGDLATDEMSAFAQGWAVRDPAGAEAFLAAKIPQGADDELPAAVQRGFERIAESRIDTDPRAAMDWYAQLPQPLRERLRQSIVAQLTIKDPRLATEWLARDDTAQLGASDLIPLLRGLRLDGFDQQFSWARAAANPVTRESALAAVVRESAPAHLVPLGEWLAARADDASLVPAFSAYALQVVRKSPAAAVTWALSLDGPDLRQNTLNIVAAEWFTVNPRAAREWAERTRLVDWDAIAR